MGRDLEILKSIADQIDDRRLLHSLVLTNKIFNFEFCRHLYRHLGPSIVFLYIQPSNSNLIHTKALTIPDVCETEWWSSTPNDKVTALVNKMERLESFTWDADEDIFHTIHRGTISSLAASCPRLKSLYLHLAPYREPEDRDVNPHDKPMEISLFGNLAPFTLSNIQGVLTECQGQTSKVLIKSPWVFLLSIPFSSSAD